MLVALFVFGPSSVVLAQQSNDFVIQDYKTTIQVQENGDLQIAERIQVYFYTPKHGIYRTIPYKYTNLSGQSVRAPLEDIQVQKRAWETTKNGDNVIIKLWSADVLVEGNQVYELSYRVHQWVRQYSGYQELYRNMMGPAWDVSILAWSFSIIFPQSIPAVPYGNWFVYYGDYGSRDALSTVQVTSGGLSGYIWFSLQAHQSVTVGIQFPDKTFSLIKPSLDLRSMLGNIAYILPLLLLLWCFTMWYRYGRDFSLPDVVSYYPPENVTPSEYILLLKGSTQAKDIIPLIYHRASQWLIIIKEEMGPAINERPRNIYSIARHAVKNAIGSQEKHYILSKLESKSAKVYEAQMKSHEKRLFYTLFDDATQVDISELDSLYPILESISDQLNAKFQYTKYYTPESRSATTKLWYIVAILVLLYGGYLFAMVYLYAYSLSLFAEGEQLFLQWILLFAFSVFVSIITIIIFAKIMHAKTKQYEQLLSSLRGYRTFIEKVEAPQLQALLKQDPNFIDKTLSYAIVLGLASSFLKVTNQALWQAYHPAWFVGHSFGTGDLSSMTSVINDISSSSRSAPPASQWSWSWGGWFWWGWGFSGGGGWGGGWGSW